MAVRDINLVPEAVLQRRYAERHAAGWVVAYGLVLALLLAAYVFTVNHATAKGRQMASEEQVRKDLAGTMAEIGVKKEGLDRLSFVRQVPRAVGAAHVLGRLCGVMDAGTWLTELTLTAQRGADAEIVMQVLSDSNAKLGATINVLANSEAFRDVVLCSASEANGSRDGGAMPEKIVQFSVTAKAVVK